MRSVLIAAGLALCASSAVAQTTVAPQFELDAGLLWIGSGTFQPALANLNGPTGNPLTLFTTSNDLSAGLGLEAHLGFPLNRRLQAEFSGSVGRADLRTQISGDLEGAEGVTATLGVSMYAAEASIVWLPRRHGKLDPFVRGGAGWLRQVTADGSLGADGVVASAGAGVKYWWRDQSKGALKRVGLRADARIVSRSGGLSLDTERRLISPAAGLSFIFGF